MLYRIRRLALFCSWSLLGAVLVALSHVSLADDDCERDCVEVGKWRFGVALGLGLRSNPIIHESDTPLVLLPQISYYGEKFFIENFDVGVTLSSSDQQQLHLLFFTPSLDHGFFNRFSVSNFSIEGIPGLTEGVPGSRETMITSNPSTELVPPDVDFTLNKRRFSGYAGLEYQVALGASQIQLQALVDVTGVHSGQEMRLAWAYPFAAGSHRFGLAAGVLHQSAEVTEYYYGVTAAEVSDENYVYQPKAGASGFLRLNWSKQITQKWQWKGSLQYRFFPATIADSPIVEDSGVATVFIGGVYHF